MPTIYATAPPDEAASIAETLVEDQLAACVNRIDCDSVYRWEGEIHDEEEVVLLAKTTTEQADALVDRLAQLHPYDVPCIERFDEAGTTEPFADWLAGAVGTESDH